MLRIRYIFFILFIATCITTFSAFAEAKGAEPSPQDILGAVPEAKSFKHIKDPIDCYRLFDALGSPVGAAVITTDVPPEIAGYRDEISLLVGVNESGVITNVKLLSHQEDREHMNSILSKGFLDRFAGQRPSGNWSDIEAITGATISSLAMCEDIRTASIAVALKVLKSGVLSQAAKKKVSSIRLDRPLIAAAASFLLVLLSIAAVYLPRRRILRSSSLLLSFVAIGILFNTPVTIGNFIDIGYGYIPGWSNLALLILLVFAIVSALFKGPVYCSYLCPFGAMQDGASAFKIPKCKIDDKWMRYAGYIRWPVLLAVIAVVAGFNIYALRNVEPFARCFAPDAGSAVWVQSGTILIAALFLRRPWCRIFCPTGLVIETLSRLGTKLRCKFKCK